MEGKLFDFNIDSQDHSFLAVFEDEDRINRNDPLRRHCRFEEDPVVGYHSSPEDEFISREEAGDDSVFEDDGEETPAFDELVAENAEDFEAGYAALWSDIYGRDIYRARLEANSHDDEDEDSEDSFDRIEKEILHRESHAHQKGAKACARKLASFDECRKFGKRLIRSCERYMGAHDKAAQSCIRKARKGSLRERFLYA